MAEKEKKKRNKQGITAKSGKAYQYTRITRKVGKHKNKRGMWVSDYKQFTGKSLKDAEAKYEKYMTRVSLNGMTAFGEYFDWFKENIFSRDDTLKEGTKIKYINDFERAFGDSPLLKCDISEISGIDIQSIINESDSGATTIRQAVKLLRRFYKYLDSQNIVHDVTRSLTLPKVEHKRIDQQVEVYTDEELKRLLNGMPEEHRLRFLVIMAINTGCRIGELLALKYDDISVEEGQVSINKTLSEIEKSKDAFLKMLSESAKITDFTTDKIAREVSKQMVEGYSVGFAEGARQNSKLMIDAMRKLIANNYLDDTDGKIEQFLQITEKQTAIAYKDMMQGETMHLYNNPPKKSGKAKKS